MDRKTKEVLHEIDLTIPGQGECHGNHESRTADRAFATRSEAALSKSLGAGAQVCRVCTGEIIPWQIHKEGSV
jgi:hypothetical protein